jgi:hypothetical protein
MAEGQIPRFNSLNDIQAELVIYSQDASEPIQPTDLAMTGTRLITLEHLLRPDTMVENPSPLHYDFNAFRLALDEICQLPINLESSMLVVEHPPGMAHPSPRFTRIRNESSFHNALYILSYELRDGPSYHRLHLDPEGCILRPKFFFPKWIRQAAQEEEATSHGEIPQLEDDAGIVGDIEATIRDVSLNDPSSTLSSPISSPISSSTHNDDVIIEDIMTPVPGAALDGTSESSSDIATEDDEISVLLPAHTTESDEGGQVLDPDVMFSGDPMSMEERGQWAKPIQGDGMSDDEYAMLLKNWEEEIAEVNRSQCV